MSVSSAPRDRSILGKHRSKARVALLALLAPVACGQSGLAPSEAGAVEQEPGATPSPTLPVRIPRAFFESKLSGILRFRASDGSAVTELKRAVTYQEGEPEGPAPTGPYIADFRDRPGFAAFEGSEGIRLRFTVVPDVSSLSVSEGKVTAEGISRLVEEHLRAQPHPSCGATLDRLEFDRARKGAQNESLEVSFLAYSTPASSLIACPRDPMRVEFTLNREQEQAR